MDSPDWLWRLWSTVVNPLHEFILKVLDHDVRQIIGYTNENLLDVTMVFILNFKIIEGKKNNVSYSLISLFILEKLL